MQHTQCEQGNNWHCTTTIKTNNATAKQSEIILICPKNKCNIISNTKICARTQLWLSLGLLHSSHLSPSKMWKLRWGLDIIPWDSWRKCSQCAIQDIGQNLSIAKSWWDPGCQTRQLRPHFAGKSILKMCFFYEFEDFLNIWCTWRSGVDLLFCIVSALSFWVANPRKIVSKDGNVM